MKSSWTRLGTAVCVLAAIAVGASALATPDLIKKDTFKCGSLKSRVCGTCEGSIYTIGLCVDDRDGSTAAISVECCCCTEGANHRSFIGG